MTAIVCLTQRSLPLARRIQAAIPGAAVHGLATRVAECDVPFADTRAHVGRLFQDGTPIVAICAAGILIRSIAPYLGNKRAEPPVLAVASDGSAIVPLIVAHGGGNKLARLLADVLGGKATLTTGGDVEFGFGLDDPPQGWVVANPEAAKGVTARLLAGQHVGLTVEAGEAAWLDSVFLPRHSREGGNPDGRPVDSRLRGNDEKGGILVTARAVFSETELVLHPPVLALGVGCERDAPADELFALAEASLAEAGLSPASVACVVSLDLKSDEAAVHALAAKLGVPARFFTAEQLLEETPRLAIPSDAVFREVGCHGVAEGAALAAVGSAGSLIFPKRKSARATCAIAQSTVSLDPDRVGRPRGKLSVVGMGPGQGSWRTPEASRALALASEIVGYRLYLDLLGDAIAGKPTHATELGEETARARRAIELAAEGRHVALVSSGDAGIYGLATLACELIAGATDPAWRRIELEFIPGISALQAAAARLGAPLGHDFCAISLSDLLTPWDAIERRLEAAGQGDFVIALYNPRSERRAWQLPRALEILKAHRPVDTPVALARNLGRADEAISVTTLSQLDPEDVDMLTLVMIGSSATRSLEFGGRAMIYTPRGYAQKRERA
jgi:cobalt-precorrin 5A hydrolase/precorrin-3B C17-methyltransferase